MVICGTFVELIDGFPRNIELLTKLMVYDVLLRLLQFGLVAWCRHVFHHSPLCSHYALNPDIQLSLKCVPNSEELYTLHRLSS